MYMMRRQQKAEKRANAAGLRRTARIGAVALIMAVFFMATLYSAAKLREALSSSTQAYVLDVTAQLADDVSARLSAHRQELLMVADSIPMLGGGERLESFLIRKQAVSGFDSLVLVDRAGNCVPDTVEMAELPGQQCIQAAFRGESRMADMEGVSIIFAVPVPGGQDEVSAVLVGLCGQKHLQQMIHSPSFSGQGQTCIVNSGGEVIVPPDDDTLFRQAGLFGADGTVHWDTLKRTKNALDQGREGLVDLPAGSGAALLLAYYPLDLNDWALLTLVPANLISGDANDYILRTYLIIGGIILAFVLLLVAVTRFYSAHKRQLEVIAYVDPITGGRNNAAFQAGCRRLTAAEPPGSYTVALLNVKGFKLVNERFGIEAGDRVLRYIYQVLRRRIGTGEIVARGESDHFFLCLRENSQTVVRERLQAMIQDINAFNDNSSDPYYFVFFQGACMVEQADTEVTILQDRARMAYQYRREEAEHGCVFYDAALSGRLKLEQELNDRFEQALREQDFQVYLQPKVSLRDGSVVGAEALVRWMHPQRGLIPPDAFIPVLERTGKIVDLDLYMFHQVCVLLDRWRREGRTVLPVSVNLSRQHFKKPEFLYRFAQVAAGFDIPHGSIEFELTESIFFDRPQIETVKCSITQMHMLGFACSLDDFGAGFSSLGLLKEFDVDTIKLDRQFFQDMSSQRAQDVIGCLLALAEKLQAKTVAEGIETQEQLVLLRQMGCDMVQGYVYARPLPAAAFEVWVDRWKASGQPLGEA